jgi:VCBS repeat-containing protein
MFCCILKDNSNNYEIIYVTSGELTNLTCFIQTSEIDWHFKDSNSTTYIISNGLKLQLIKPTKNEEFNLKYHVTSDERSYHMLSIYIQGKQDEGIYQCVDSKSETPIKKNIKLLLSKLIKLNE